ncbi:MAG: winged helix-turn-helix transcriptional regulator [Halobacterium sp.]
MQERVDGRDDPSVLRSKGDASRYQILVHVTERQPTVSQQEIAERVGMSSQAVSDYLQELVERGFVRKHGRLRYEVTSRGVDWLASRTETLRRFVDRVSSDVLDEVDVDDVVEHVERLRNGDVAYEVVDATEGEAPRR